MTRRADRGADARHLRFERSITSPFEHVADVLGVRPATWLRRFLLLAAVGEGSMARSASAHWYRLGPQRRVAGGASAALTWWPHLDTGLFESFHGSIAAVSRAQGSSLVIQGDVRGGLQLRDDEVLTALMTLLASAIEGVSSTDSR